MSSKETRITQEVQKMLFLAESTRKEAQEKTVEKKPTKGPFIDYKSTNEREILPFPMKYAMISRGGNSFKEDMAYAFLSLKEAGKSTEETVSILAPHLKSDTSFKGFIQSLEKAQETSGIKNPNQATELLYQIPEELQKYGDEAKSRYFEHAMGDEKSMISYNWSDKKLSPRGYWQLQFLARVASGQAVQPEEKALFASKRADLYKRRADDTLRSFYKKAILPIAVPLMGRDSKDFEIADRDVEFKISIEDAVDKMIDNIGQYDASRNNIGAWAFTVMKNQLKDILKKFTSQKLRTGIDTKSGINIADAFEQNNWSDWSSTLDPEIAMGENGGIDKDRIAGVESMGEGVWDYQFKTPADAYAEFVEAADGEANNIFTKDNLTKSELKKLQNVGAFLSVKKDVGFEDPGSSEQPDVADDVADEQEPMSSVDADEAYEDVFEEVLASDEQLGSQIKDKLGAYVKENGTEEIGRLLYHFIEDFDYKFFKNRDKKISKSDFEKIVAQGKEKYGEDWKNFPKEKFNQSLGKKYTNDEGDIYPELEPYVDAKMVKRGQEGGFSGAGKKISQEDFIADQKERGAKPFSSTQWDVISGAATRALKNGINRNSKLGKTIEKLFNYRRGNLEEGMNQEENIENVIKEAIQEVLSEFKPQRSLLEANTKINLLRYVLAPQLVKKGAIPSTIKEDFKIKSDGSFAGNTEDRYDKIISENEGIKKLFNLITQDKGLVSIISEATGEEWSSHIKNRWTGENAKWPMTQDEIEDAEDEIKKAATGRAGFDEMSKWMKEFNNGKGSKKALYTINRIVEEYQKTGNPNLYTWLLSFYMTDPTIRNNFVGKLKNMNVVNYDAAESDLGSEIEMIENAIMNKMELMMQKYNPQADGSGDFYNYTFQPRVSNILRDIQTQFEKKYGVDLSSGDSDEDGTKSDLEKVQNQKAVAQHQSDNAGNTLADKANELKNGVYNNIKANLGDKIANVYYDYFIKGVPSWTELAEDSEDWERYGIRGKGKLAVAKKVLIPGLVNKGMNAKEVAKDFNVNKNTGAIPAIPQDRKTAYEAAMADDQVLKRIYDFIVNDKDLDFRNPNTVPLNYIWNKGVNQPTPAEAKGGFIATIESVIKELTKTWGPIIQKMDAKYPGMSKVLLSNPYKGQTDKSHRPDPNAEQKWLDYMNFIGPETDISRQVKQDIEDRKNKNKSKASAE